jgi:hypothetical protein
MQATSWALWAVVLFLQNISFTYVSRARSSGSIARHLKASIFSNGIWIFSQIIMLGYMFEALTGKHGRALQIETASVYTVACVAGSIFAHWLAMKTEKGKNAVGFNKKYAQIPVEDYARLLADVEEFKKLPTAEEFQRIRGLAENAYDITVGMIPDSGVSAQKVGNLTVTTGLPKAV